MIETEERIGTDTDHKGKTIMKNDLGAKTEREGTTTIDPDKKRANLNTYQRISKEGTNESI